MNVKSRISFVLFFFGFGVITILLFSLAIDPIKVKLAEIHQEGITRELREWEIEFQSISTWSQAIQAIDMLSYVQTYYVVGAGYRSTPETEAKLESQRKKTIVSIVRALQVYSGDSIGNDPNAWDTWRKTIGKQKITEGQ